MLQGFYNFFELKGYKYPFRGSMIPLEEFRYNFKGVYYSTRGIRYPSWGFIIPLEGFRHAS